MKYPRTPHLPWSVGGTADDVRLASTEHFADKTFIYFEKLDGETTACSKESIHARSEDGWGQSWQHYMSSEYHRFNWDIPEGMWIFGENMYAIHSIEYEFLPSYFFVFTIAYKDEFLALDDVLEWCEYFKLPLCPYFYISSLQELSLPSHSTFGKKCEGYVVRNVEAFGVEDFATNVAKCVRKGHVKTAHGWKTRWKPAKLGKFKHELLTRDQFRGRVFQRDSYKCVVCGKKAVDAHHLLERRLWPDGGYYIENGASLCETHHRQAEKGIVTVEDLRSMIGIMRRIVPPQLSIDRRYNKWGEQLPFGEKHVLLQDRNTHSGG